MKDINPYHVGRVISWLEAILFAGQVNDKIVEAVGEVITSLKEAKGDPAFHFGQAVSWLQSLGAALPAEDKMKVKKLLTDVETYWESDNVRSCSSESGSHASTNPSP